MAKGNTEELCEYLNVKSARIVDKEEQADQSAAGLNGRLFKHWTMVWVVLHTEISPAYSFIGHCKKESDWLAKNKIEKLFLGDPFDVEKLPTGYSKKFEFVVQVTFKVYRVDLAFDSKTKMEQWYNRLRTVLDCYHVDLVRCPEHPDYEGEYVIEVGPNYYKAWSFQSDRQTKLKWDWHLKHIRRVHWHKNVHKLEVEPGRSSQTGEGHYFFTGQHASRLFTVMRHMMTNRSGSSTPTLPTPLPPQSSRRLSESQSSPLLHSMQVNPMYPRIERIGVEPQSEDDWTGDSWTGTSDSGFFMGSNVPRPSETRNHFILPSGPAPPLPPERGPRQNASHYMALNVSSLDKDNDYVQIRKREHVYDHVPSEDGSKTPTTDRPHYQVPRPHLNTSTSQNGTSRLSITDDYCQMSSVVINREIKRNGSLPMERPPPIPPHQRGVSPSKALAGTHSGARTNRH